MLNSMAKKLWSLKGAKSLEETVYQLIDKKKGVSKTLFSSSQIFHNNCFKQNAVTFRNLPRPVGIFSIFYSAI